MERRIQTFLHWEEIPKGVIDADGKDHQGGNKMGIHKCVNCDKEFDCEINYCTGGHAFCGDGYHKEDKNDS